ncbi:MAG: hypothetical protein MJA82_20580 [Clostridia bacterium]|nr:hypothetical protein [Clostridia bacterium]
MIISNSNIYELTNNINSYIDNKTAKYFSNIEVKLLNYLHKYGRIYDVQKKDIINKVFNNKDFHAFISDLIKEIDDLLIQNHIDLFKKQFNLNVDSLSEFNLNSHLLNEYRFSYFLGKIIEKNIDQVIGNCFSNSILEYLWDKILSADTILSFANLSSASFNKRHSMDIERRVKGILINLKIKFKNDLKSQVYEYISLIQRNNLKTA